MLSPDALDARKKTPRHLSRRGRGWFDSAFFPQPVGLEDVSGFPNLLAELLRRGYSEEDVQKVAGLNLLRVIRQVEKAAARLQRKTGPSDVLIEELDRTSQ